MNLPIRSILALSILVVVLAACGTTAGAPVASPAVPTAPAEPTPRAEPTAPAEPTVAPTQAPTEAPDPAPGAPREVAGTISVAEGMAFSGPGGSIQEALDAGPSGEYPTLVNGVLLKDVDGTIYLADSVTDEAAPTFGGPMLLVLNYQEGDVEWDMQYADLLGLQEANGILFRQNAQILGYVELP